MRKNVMILVILMILGVLGACGDMSKSDVVEKVAEKVDDIETYSSESGLDIEILRDDTGERLDKSTANLDFDIDEENSIMTGSAVNMASGATEKLDFFADEDTSYVSTDGSRWEIATNPDEQVEIDDLLYKDVVNIIQEIEEEVDMEETDGHYTLQFQGKSQSIFDAFKGPFNLSVTGVGEDEIEHDVLVEIDKDTFHLKHISDELTGVNQGEKIIFQVDQEYRDINDIDGLEIPDKVVEEAE